VTIKTLGCADHLVTTAADAVVARLTADLGSDTDEYDDGGFVLPPGSTNAVATPPSCSTSPWRVRCPVGELCPVATGGREIVCHVNAVRPRPPSEVWVHDLGWEIERE
jgi:hypothetical protein